MAGQEAPMEKIHYLEREAEIYDLEYGWKTDDLGFWLGVAREFAAPAGPVLELGCGTLRLLLPLAQAGFTITGMDVSPHMLARGQDKLARESAKVRERVTLVEGDMSDFHLGERFRLIFVAFSSFLILTTIEEQESTLRCVREHLTGDGVFGLDIFFPDIARLAQTREWQLMEVDQTAGDVRFQRDFRRKVDRVRQRMDITFRMREYRHNVLEREWLSDLSITYIFHRELLHLLDKCGFEVVHLWGDYQRTDFYDLPNPGKQLVIARSK